jgi:hypothetical protein
VTNSEIETVLKKIIALTAKTADQVASLVERTDLGPGMFGDRPSDAREIAQSLRQDAAKLRESLGNRMESGVSNAL